MSNQRTLLDLFNSLESPPANLEWDSALHERLEKQTLKYTTDSYTKYYAIALVLLCTLNLLSASLNMRHLVDEKRNYPLENIAADFFIISSSSNMQKHGYSGQK